MDRKPESKPKNIDLKRGALFRMLVGGYEITAAPYLRRGKLALKVWGPDGMEIQRIRKDGEG